MYPDPNAKNNKLRDRKENKKMKHLKKLGSVLLALVMVLALAAPAFADDPINGTITVTNATVGKEYAVYKIFDAEYSENNRAIYTIASDSPWRSAVERATDLFTLTLMEDGTTYNVVIADSVNAEAVSAWIGTLDPLPQHVVAKTATTTEIEFTNLDAGYYLVTSTLGTVITLTNANPDASIIDKNQTPGKPTKTTKNGVETVTIGQEVEYEITYTATNYNKEDKVVNYVFTDTMDPVLELVSDSIKVTVTGPEENAEPVDITARIVRMTTAEGETFKIAIPWVGNYDNSLYFPAEGNNTEYAKSLYDNATHPHIYESPSTITVSYKATVLPSAADKIEQTLKNEIVAQSNTVNGEGPKEPSESEDEFSVDIFALAIKKVDPKGNPLAGAKFILKDEAGEEVKVSAVEGNPGQYVVDPEGTAEIVSPADGVIIIKGVSGQKYTLTETVAPQGYNLLTDPKEITPVKTGQATTTTTIYKDADGNIVSEKTETTTEEEITIADLPATAVVIVNTNSALLPSTGGIGTTIFYIVGGILVLGAVVLLITKRRTSVDDE